MALGVGGPITEPNPDNPTCDCAACGAVRELSAQMLPQPNVVN
jgi:hypothetical protein